MTVLSPPDSLKPRIFGLSNHAGAELAEPELTPRATESALASDMTGIFSEPGAEMRYTIKGSKPTRHGSLISSEATTSNARHWRRNDKASLGAEIRGSTTENLRGSKANGSGCKRGTGLSVCGRNWTWSSETRGRLNYRLAAAAGFPDPERVRLGAEEFENGVAPSVGHDHSLVIDQYRKLWIIGDGSLGQHGDNTCTERPLPVQILPSNLVSEYLDNGTAANAVESLSVAMTASGDMHIWVTESTSHLSESQDHRKSWGFAGPIQMPRGPSRTGDPRNGKARSVARHAAGASRQNGPAKSGHSISQRSSEWMEEDFVHEMRENPPMADPSPLILEDRLEVDPCSRQCFKQPLNNEAAQARRNMNPKQ